MKLELSKKYVTRGGLVTGPLRRSNNGTNYTFEADVQEPGYPDKSVLSWLPDGYFLGEHTPHEYDLIREL